MTGAQGLDACVLRCGSARMDDVLLGLAGSPASGNSGRSAAIGCESDRRIARAAPEGNAESNTVVEVCLVDSAPLNARLTRVNDGGTISTDGGGCSEANAAGCAGT